MNLHKTKHLVFSLAAGGLFLVTLFLLLKNPARPAHAAPGELFASPAGSGTACTQAAPCALQTALDSAVDGDTIYSAQGVYTGSGGAVLTVTKSITLYGGWDGTLTTPVVRDAEAYPTTLHGEDGRRVVAVQGSISPTIDGFIITGGNGANGGGVYIFDAAPLIQNNVITANRTITSAYDGGRGGGIFIGGESKAVIARNRILSNTSGYGGGLYHIGNTAVTITANLINDNVAGDRGGGFMLELSPDIVQANVISGNTAVRDGGGVMIWAASPRLDGNQIQGNAADLGGGLTMGNNARPDLFNNLLIDNSKDGILVNSSSPVVVNNTIVGSALPDSGKGIYLTSPSCSPPYCTTGNVLNNVIISYEVGIFGSGLITPVIDYNDVWGNTVANYSLPSGVVTGTHNFSLDPLFVNPAVHDYHLQPGSPCVDAGDPAGAPPAPPTDIDGDIRPTGGGVDVGADELALKIFLPAALRD